MRFRRGVGGKTAKLTLGRVDTTSRRPEPEPQMGGALLLSEARVLASQVQNQRAKPGADPAAERQQEKRRAKVEAETRGDRSFPSFARLFVRQHCKVKQRRWRESASCLGLDFHDEDLPVVAGSVADRWRDREAKSITKADVVEEVDRATRRARTAGNHLFHALRAMFNWHAKRGALDSSPCDRMDAPVSQKQLRRQRMLSDDELRCVWRAMDEATVPRAYAAMIRFALLTAVRRDEARLARTTEVTGDEWTVPGTRTKNHLDHLVTMSPAAREQLARGREKDGSAGWAFTVTGRTALGALSKWKRRVALRALALLKEIAAKKNDRAALAKWEEIERAIVVSADRKAKDADRKAAREKLRREGWHLHDFRRNARSFVSRVTTPDVAERVLAHVPSGLRATYDLHQYRDEKARALALWAKEVERIISGDGGKVITMRGGRGARS